MTGKKQSLDVSMLSDADIKNLALQRTGSLLSVSLFGKRFSPAYHLWSKSGSDILLNIEVRKRRNSIISVALREISQEFNQIYERLHDENISSIMDIGCGLGIIDAMFGWTGLVSKITLVDIEESARKHHGFEDEGSGYNSLNTSKDFLMANISNDINIYTINPKFDSMMPENIGKFDLIMSLISCGFHYPAETYLSEIKSLLSDNGLVLIDLRHGVDHSKFLSEFTVVAEIVDSNSHRRLMLKLIR